MSSEFVIDLDELFSLKYSFKPLQLLLEKIIQNQKIQQEEIVILKSLNQVEKDKMAESISNIIIKRKQKSLETDKNNQIPLVESERIKPSENSLEINVEELQKQVENNVYERIKMELNQEIERKENYKKLKKKIDKENTTNNSKEEKINPPNSEFEFIIKDIEEKIEKLENNSEKLKETTNLSLKEIQELGNKVFEFDNKIKEINNFLVGNKTILQEISLFSENLKNLGVLEMLTEIKDLKQNQEILKETNFSVINTNGIIKNMCEDLSKNFALLEKQKDSILLEIKAIKHKQDSETDTIQQISQNLQTRIDKDTFKNLREEVKVLSYKLMEMGPISEHKGKNNNMLGNITDLEKNSFKNSVEKINLIEESVSKLWKAIKDLNILEIRKELHEAKEKLEDKVDVTVINQMKMSISKIDERINEIETNLEKFSKKQEEDIGIMNGNIENLSNDMHSTNNMIADLMANKDNRGSNTFLKSLSPNQISETKISAVVEDQELISIRKMCDMHDKAIKRLKQEQDSFKQLNTQFEKIFNIISSKIDISDHEKLKNELINYIEDILLNLNKKFAEKQETRKYFKSLENQIKTVIEMVIKDEKNVVSDSAMIAKRPLQGWACASCEKDIINLQGQISAYNSWNKMPLRENGERMSKLGLGFSKILSSLDSENANLFKEHKKGIYVKRRLSQEPNISNTNSKDNILITPQDQNNSTHFPNIEKQMNKND